MTYKKVAEVQLPKAATAGLPAGSKPRAQMRWDRKTAGLNFIRDQLSLRDWLLVGATLQAILTALAPSSISRTIVVLPVLVMAVWKTLQAVVAVSSYRPGGDEVISDKLGANMESDEKSDGGMCILLLGAKSNHPLGIFAPGFGELGVYVQKMVQDLEVNADEYDFLGVNSYLSVTDGTRSNEAMSHYYFRNYAGLHKFAHSKMHREGWDWWNRTIKEHPHIGICHEVYDAPAGNWEAIYVNYRLSGLGATAFSVTDKTGQKVFRSPMESASSGRLRTSMGRMSKTDGTDNEKYGEP